MATVPPDHVRSPPSFIDTSGRVGLDRGQRNYDSPTPPSRKSAPPPTFCPRAPTESVEVFDPPSSERAPLRLSRRGRVVCHTRARSTGRRTLARARFRVFELERAHRTLALKINRFGGTRRWTRGIAAHRTMKMRKTNE